MKYPEIHKRFVYILELRQMRAADLAEKTDISKAAISHYVNGNRCPTSAVALKLGKILKCSPLWLMDLSDNMDVKIINEKVDDELTTRLLAYFDAFTNAKKNELLNYAEFLDNKKE